MRDDNRIPEFIALQKWHEEKQEFVQAFNWYGKQYWGRSEFYLDDFRAEAMLHVGSWRIIKRFNPDVVVWQHDNRKQRVDVNRAARP